MSRGQPSKELVQIHPKPRDRLFPIVDIQSLPASTPCSRSCTSSSTAAFATSVRNKYIMKRFTNDLEQFAIPQISTKYKLDKRMSTAAPLMVKGKSISRISSTIPTRTPSRKTLTDDNSKDITRTVCLEGCRYDVVRRIALELHFCEVTETEYWNILWTDSPISMERAYEIRRVQQQNIQHSYWGPTMNAQKMNHFPGMHEICRKDRLAKNLNRMQKIFPEDYLFYPRTWTLPSDIPELLAYFRTNKSQTIICKPDSGCQGKGIFLVRNLKKMNPFAKLIAQIYIPNPLLIDGFKFDLRLYILITSIDPLRMYIYNEGIARFATVKYAVPNDHNVDVVFMHLTNYSLNKYSQSYVPEPEGSKRKLSTVYGYLLERGFNVDKLVENIDEIIIKTVMAAQPTLSHQYNASFPQDNPGGSSCFEILGFDVLIDENLNPWLLEVNLSPSFNLDLAVDAEVKEALLKDVFYKIFLGTVRDKGFPEQLPKKGIVSQSPSEVEIMDKAGNNIPRSLQKQYHHESMNQGNFRLIYPTDNCYKYAEFVDPDLNLVSGTDFHVPISRRGSSLPSYSNETDDSTGIKIIHRRPFQPTQYPPLPKLSVQSARIAPREPLVCAPRIVAFKPTAEPASVYTSGGSDSSASPFNQLESTVGYEKGDPLPEGKPKKESKASKKKKKKKKNAETASTPEVTSRVNRDQQSPHKVRMAQLLNERGAKERIIVNVQDGLGPIHPVQLKPDSSQVKVTKKEKVKVAESPRQEPQPIRPEPPIEPAQSSKRIERVELSSTKDKPRPSYVPVSKIQPRSKFTPQVETTQSAQVVPNLNAPLAKNKVVEEWILNGATAVQSRRKPKVILPKAERKLSQKWDNFTNEALKKSRTSTARSFVLAATPHPVLPHEEVKRQGMLRERDRAVRQMGIERKVFEMMQGTGTLSMEEDLIYHKIFSEEEFLANRNGSSTLFNLRTHSVVDTNLITDL